MNNNEGHITEATIFSGFNKVTREVLLAWKEFIIQFEDVESEEKTLMDMNKRLGSNNIVVFFDHHYAFDPIPMGLAFAKYVQNLKGLIIPYAVHLDMGVGRVGEFSIRYKSRTLVFEWFMRNIRRNNPNIQFLAVVREFEMETPRLREIVEAEYAGVNTKYIRTFAREFAQNDNGQACFLSPFSGIGFPGKPALHPQLHRSLKIAHGKAKNGVSYYLVGAYPSWEVQRQYYAPLFSKHTIIMRGPIDLPVKDYEESKDVMDVEIQKLRKQADFKPPDYDRLLTK